MPDQGVAQLTANQRFVHARWQALLRELDKRPREQALAQRATPSQVESAQPAQQRIGVEPLHQGRGLGQAQHRFSASALCPTPTKRAAQTGLRPDDGVAHGGFRAGLSSD